MKKSEFIIKLSKKLTENKVIDIEEIIEEYENHFIYKLEDGYSEEEISRKLGNPILLADQYIDINEEIKSKKGFISIVGLIFGDIFVLSFFITFISWVIILATFSVASLSIGISLFVNVSPYGLIPYLPYWNGAVLGVSFISLTLLSLIATYYNYLYMLQLVKSYIRFHKNIVAMSKEKPTLPSLPSHPILSKRNSRRMRTIFLVSLNSFAISFVLGYVVCALAANSFEFWHVFGWFV